MEKGGATFAYFSVSVQGNQSTTTVTATTGKVGIFTIAEDSKNDLTLSITSTEMAKSLIDGETTKSIDYFVKAAGGKTTRNVSGDEDQAPEDSDYITISKLTLSNADNGVKYHCQGLYTIKAVIGDNSEPFTDQASTLKDSVQDTDGRLYLKTKAGSGAEVNIANDEGGQPDSSAVESINHSLKSLLSEEKTFWVTYDYTSSGTSIDGELQATFKISNRNAEQNYLADKKITVTLTPSEEPGKKLACDIVQPED